MLYIVHVEKHKSCHTFCLFSKINYDEHFEAFSGETKSFNNYCCVGKSSDLAIKLMWHDRMKAIDFDRFFWYNIWISN